MLWAPPGAYNIMSSATPHSLYLGMSWAPPHSLISNCLGLPHDLPCKYHIITNIPLSIKLTIIPYISTTTSVPHSIKWASLGALDPLVWSEDPPDTTEVLHIKL